MSWVQIEKEVRKGNPFTEGGLIINLDKEREKLGLTIPDCMFLHEVIEIEVLLKIELYPFYFSRWSGIQCVDRCIRQHLP